MAANQGFGRKTARDLIRDADHGREVDDISVEDLTVEADISVVEDSPTGRQASDSRSGDLTVAENLGWRRSGLIEESTTGKRPRSLGWWLQVLTIPLLVLVGAAVWFNVVRIQDNVEDAAVQILRDAGVDTSTLSFDASFRDLEVSGVLPAGANADEIERLLESETGPSGEDIRNVTVTATLAASAPIDIVVTADGLSLVISGQVPSQSDLDAIRTAAELAGVALTTNVDVSGASVQSENHDDLIAALVAVLPRLGTSVNSAELRLDDVTLSGSIQAATASVRAELENLPELANSTVVISSLGEVDTEFTFDGSRIVLNGNVLTASQRDTLVAAAEAAVGSDNVINNLTVLAVEGAVEGSDARIRAAADVLRTFEGFNFADARLTDTDLTVNGEAFDPDARAPIDDALAAATATGLQLGGNVTNGLQFTLQEEIDLLQAELDALQDQIRENVRFDTNSAQLSDQAGATLDEVVAAMNRYTRPVVEIGGHTDSIGNERVNQRLSARRATAVARYIERAGVGTSRLNPVGYGETEPLVDNTTSDGRDENRRVEFTARESF